MFWSKPKPEPLVRTWYRCTSGRVFRNCGLINLDRANPRNRQYLSELEAEWRDTFWHGVMKPGSKFNPAEPGPADVFLPYDDSEEATERWAQRFLASGGRDVTG
jgi:hypothetical protein